MSVYDKLLQSIAEEYDVLNELKSGPRGIVSIVRHRRSGKRFLFRNYIGNCEVYQQLISISTPYLPRIMEAAQKGEYAAVLEEYVQGDTVAFLLEGSLFTLRQTRKIAKQLCLALWILHSMGAVHRDVKPENVILRGGDAVLVDFDASRLYKNEQKNDTRVLGTTGFAAPEQYGISQSDGRADIYALGILMNIMLTGKHPSIKLTDGRMGRIIQRCTMVSPEKRYKDILQLMEIL